MGISGLTKDAQDKRKTASSNDLDILLSGAQVSTRKALQRKTKSIFKRCGWSLTEEISDAFKKFAKDARKETGDDFKDNQAVKAAYLCFSELSAAKRLEYMKRVKSEQL